MESTNEWSRGQRLHSDPTQMFVSQNDSRSSASYSGSLDGSSACRNLHNHNLHNSKEGEYQKCDRRKEVWPRSHSHSACCFLSAATSSTRPWRVSLSVASCTQLQALSSSPHKLPVHDKNNNKTFQSKLRSSCAPGGGTSCAWRIETARSLKWLIQGLWQHGCVFRKGNVVHHRCPTLVRRLNLDLQCHVWPTRPIQNPYKIWWSSAIIQHMQ